MDFLIEILLICFQAMNESGLTWPLIAEDEQSVKWDASSPQFTSVTTCSGVFEKHLVQAGLPDTKVEWVTLAAGSAAMPNVPRRVSCPRLAS
jgi:hypothetical protein